MCKIIHYVWNYTLCVKFHAVCKTTHFVHAITKQFLLRTNWKILHLTEFFYTTSGCDGCDKYEVWTNGPALARFRWSCLWTRNSCSLKQIWGKKHCLLWFGKAACTEMCISHSSQWVAKYWSEYCKNLIFFWHLSCCAEFYICMAFANALQL